MKILELTDDELRELDEIVVGRWRMLKEVAEGDNPSSAEAKAAADSLEQLASKIVEAGA